MASSKVLTPMDILLMAKKGSDIKAFFSKSDATTIATIHYILQEFDSFSLYIGKDLWKINDPEAMMPASIAKKDFSTVIDWLIIIDQTHYGLSARGAIISTSNCQKTASIINNIAESTKKLFF